MYYPDASLEEISYFQKNGFIVVKHAVDLEDIQVAHEISAYISKNPVEFLGLDWAWDSGSLKEREFHLVQVSLTNNWSDAAVTPWRKWATRFSSQLMGFGVEFWYDQILAKPPYHGARTPWHQDEGYWGKNLKGKGITCWMPFHDVTIEMGYMKFIRGGHKDVILTHERPPGMKSDILSCDKEVDENRAVSCPIKVGSVTFHHSATPHMTSNNGTGQWRRSLAQHFKDPMVEETEEGNYPWRKGEYNQSYDNLEKIRSEGFK